MTCFLTCKKIRQFDDIHVCLQTTTLATSIREDLPKSVFSRLGDMASTSSTQKVTLQPVVPSKWPQTIVLSSTSDDEDNQDEEIDYTTHSVLRPPPKKKQTAKVKPVKTVKPVKRTVGVVSQISDISSTKSVFSRLGPK